MVDVSHFPRHREKDGTIDRESNENARASPVRDHADVNGFLFISHFFSYIFSFSFFFLSFFFIFLFFLLFLCFLIFEMYTTLARVDRRKEEGGGAEGVDSIILIKPKRRGRLRVTTGAGRLIEMR